MPYLSDEELSREIESAGKSSASVAVQHDDPTAHVLTAMGSMGSAAAIGLVRSKLEDPATGEWLIPGTRWDAEGCLFVGLAGLAAFGNYFGAGGARSYAAIAAIGIGSHYLGEVARRFGRTGELSFSSAQPEAQWQVPGSPSLSAAA